MSASEMKGNNNTVVIQQFVVQTFLEKGNDPGALIDDYEREKEQEEEKFEIPQFIGITLDLVKKNLKELPEKLMDRSLQVQYLYLEGNRITELPKDFFHQLSKLKWADLRNNDLTALPTYGLDRHPNLEVLLLQGNRIKNLPTELATISNLKGLQTAGNPIENVPFEVIAAGFKSIMQYLEKISGQTDVLRPVSETVLKASSSKVSEESSEGDAARSFYTRTEDLDLAAKRRPKRKKSHPTRLHSPLLNSALQVQSYPNLPETGEQTPENGAEDQGSIKKPSPSYRSVCTKRKFKVISTTHHFVKQRKTRMGYKRKPLTKAMIQEKAAKEIYRAQLRETLEKQAQKIQRMKDAEFLKSWRRHSRKSQEQIKLLDNFQEYPSKDFASKTPFDVDPEFLNMLSRADLYRSLKELEVRAKKNRKRKPKPKLTAIDLEDQMAQVMSKLQRLDIAESEASTPRTRQNKLTARLQQIMEVQKALKRLHALNSVTGAAPPPVRKLRPEQNQDNGIKTG